MKFIGTIFTVGLALGAIAEPIPKPVAKRDLQAFLDAISSINEQVLVLDAAVADFTDDSTELEAASDELIARLNTGTETVNAQPELNTIDALGLVGPIQDLTADTESAIDVTIGREPDFIAAGIEGLILDSLTEQKSSSDQLATAITSKVPEALRDIADELSKGIAEALQRGIDAYSD